MALVCEFDLVSDIFGLSETPELGIPIDYSEACDTFIRVFLDEAYDLVPVDTGTLMGSIDGDTDDDGWIRVIADTDYAQYVEFGTYKMDAQPYFIPACQRAWAEAMPIAQEAIEEALEEEEELLEEMEEEESLEFKQTEHYYSMGNQGSSLGSAVGGFLGAIIAGIIVAIINIFFDAISPEGSSHSGGYSHQGRSYTSADAGAASDAVENFIYIE